MATMPIHTFECQLYVPAHGPMSFRLPDETGPTRVNQLRPLEYAQLSDPGFRRLLAAFERIQLQAPAHRV